MTITESPVALTIVRSPHDPLPMDQTFMSRALELAHVAEAAGEVPVGAVIVKDGAIAA